MQALLRRLFPDVVRVATSDDGDTPIHALLMPEEADAIQRAVPARQREFALGRWCARQAMAALGVPAGPILVGPNRAPRWPSGIVGSITHCKGFVGAAAAPADRLRAVGFDAEPAVPLDEDLIPLICTPAEVAWMKTTPAHETPPSGWPKVIFSAKESIHKCVWPLWGRNLDFLDVTLTLNAPRGVFRAEAAVPAAADVGLSQLSGRMIVDGPHVFTSAFVDVTPESDGR